MKTNSKKTEGNTGELKIEIDKQVWNDAQEKSFKKLASNVSIKGFRQGKAPVSLVKKEISTDRILSDAMDSVLEVAYPKALEECDVKPITNPELVINAMSETELVVTLKIQVRPEVKLGKYTDLGIEKAVVEVSKEDIQEELERIAGQSAEVIIKDDAATVEENDIAVIDFEGFLDGVAFDGGKGEGHELTIGSKSFIPGFEEQLIGMHKNETKDITVTFPTEYGAVELAGKEVIFKVTVHEIKEKKAAEINDDLALDAGIDGVETLEDLKLNITTKIANNKEKEAEDNFLNALHTAIMENSEVDVPEVMVVNETNAMLEDIKNNIQSQGLDFATYLSITNSTEESVIESIKPEALKRVTMSLILEEIVVAENLEVTKEELEAHIASIAEMYGEEYEKIKSIVEAQKEMIKHDLRMKKASDLIRGIK